MTVTPDNLMLAKDFAACKRLVRAFNRKGVTLKLLRSGTVEIVNAKRLTQSDRQAFMQLDIAAFLRIPQLEQQQRGDRAAFNVRPKRLFTLELRASPSSTPLMATVYGIAERTARERRRSKRC